MQRYTIEEKLGEGGMGVVYRARQNDLNRLVAIKYLLPDGDLTDVAVARFKREMDVLMALSHPNIVKVFDAGQSDGKLYYVMEMMEAHDLQSIVRDRGALPAEPVASVLAQVLDALVYVHAKGLIHRDIKPANIMLEEAGRAVLMDFGLVRKMESATMLTAEGKLLGTPRYFAPEYIKGEPSTVSGDIWALGVTAYEMLAGDRPFHGNTLPELALAIVKTEPKPLMQLAPGTPPALRDIVHRMLAKDPKERWASAADCLAALRNSLDANDLDRSVELSHELSPELMQKLAIKRPEGRKTGKMPRVTGKVQRPTRPVPRATAQVAALPPRPGSRAAYVLVCVVLFVASGLYLFRRPPAPPPAPAAQAPLGEPKVEYTAPDRLTATFDTPDAAVWTLTCDGASTSDAQPATAHALSVAANPLRAPEKIQISSGPRLLELRPPPSPRDRVRGLEQALASLNVSEKSSDQLWHQIRQRLSEWRHVSVGTWDRPAPPPREESATPAIAQRGIKADPSIALLYEMHVKGIREDAAVKRHLDALLALAPAMLMSEEVPQEVRDELLGVLFRLDLVDGLGEYMGFPPPFAVGDAMKPAIEVAEERVAAVPDPLPQGLASVYKPAERSSGTAVFYRGEDFLNVGGGRLDAAVAMEPSLVGWDHAEEVKLGTTVAAGAGGRRIHLWILGVSTQLFPYLIPQGYKNGVPVRLRGKFHGLQGKTHFAVTLRGPLAGPGYWKLHLRRLFEPASRTYYGLMRAGAESLSR